MVSVAHETTHLRRSHGIRLEICERNAIRPPQPPLSTRPHLTLEVASKKGTECSDKKSGDEWMNGVMFDMIN